jgi:hypothetical protein
VKLNSNQPDIEGWNWKKNQLKEGQKSCVNRPNQQPKS